MHIERKELLSADYWLKDLFVSSPFITIVRGFPPKLLTLPTVSVVWETIDSAPFELGNKTQLKEIRYSFDVFALNEDQRDEIIFEIYNQIDMGIPIYDYDEGFPPLVSPTRLGCIYPIRKHASNIPLYPNLVTQLYYRASITAYMVYDKV